MFPVFLHVSSASHKHAPSVPTHNVQQNGHGESPDRHLSRNHHAHDLKEKSDSRQQRKRRCSAQERSQNKQKTAPPQTATNIHHRPHYQLPQAPTSPSLPLSPRGSSPSGRGGCSIPSIHTRALTSSANVVAPTVPTPAPPPTPPTRPKSVHRPLWKSRQAASTPYSPPLPRGLLISLASTAHGAQFL